MKWRRNMRTKKIIIKTREQFFEELRLTMHAVSKGEKVKPKVETSFESLDAVRTILTENRLDIWRAIRDKKPKTITELSKILGRSFRAIHRDLELLEEFDLIKLTKKKGVRGMVQVPTSLVDQLEFKIA